MKTDNQKRREEDAHLPLFVVALGSATIDTILYNNHKPIDLTAGKQTIASVMQYPGGGAINTAIAFASQGNSTAAIASLGNDYLADMIITKLSTLTIATNHLVHKKIPTRQSFIFEAPNNETAILCHTPTEHKLHASEIDFDIIAQAHHLHISSLNLVEPQELVTIVSHAHSNNTTIGYTPNTFFIKHHANIIFKILPMLTIFICNRHELAMLLPGLSLEQAVAKLASYTAAYIIITADKDGSYAYHQDTLCHQPIIAGPVINTTGAGDTFAAIASSEIIKKGCIKTALYKAAHAAQKIVSQHQPTL